MLDVAVNAPAVPPTTVMSLAAKSVLASLKVKVYVTSPVAVPALLSVIATVGAMVSIDAIGALVDTPVAAVCALITSIPNVSTSLLG